MSDILVKLRQKKWFVDVIRPYYREKIKFVSLNVDLADIYLTCTVSCGPSIDRLKEKYLFYLYSIPM